MTSDSTERPKAVLVSLQLPSVTDEQHDADVAELGRLVHTLGLDVIGRVDQRRAHPRAGTVLGLGKLAELAAWTGGTGKVQTHAPKKNKLRTRLEKEAEAEAEEEEDDDAFAATEADAEDSPDDFQIPTDARADVVVVDHELTPREARNLERATGAE